MHITPEERVEMAQAENRRTRERILREMSPETLEIIRSEAERRAMAEGHRVKQYAWLQLTQALAALCNMLRVEQIVRSAKEEIADGATTEYETG
jgi:hypothetical protein